MGLRWDFDHKVGTMTGAPYGETWTYNLYQGNALLIVVAEWEQNGDKYYNVVTWLSDRKTANKALEDGAFYHLKGFDVTLYADQFNRKADLNYLVKALPKYCGSVTIQEHC